MTVDRLRREPKETAAGDVGRCRIASCGGPLRFEGDALGRRFDVCLACEERANRLTPVDKILEKREHEILVLRQAVKAQQAEAQECQRRANKAEERAERLREQIRFLHARGQFVWEPGLCVRCGKAVTYSGLGRVPLYCDDEACMPYATRKHRERVERGE